MVVLYANGGGPATASRNGGRVTGGDGDGGRRSVSVWVSVTKVDRGRLLSKFRKFFGSLVGRLGRCRAAVQLNVIADNASRAAVDGVVSEFAALHPGAETRLTVNAAAAATATATVATNGANGRFAAGPLRSAARVGQGGR